MDRLHQITPDISVGSQLAPADVADLAAQGFRAIISNRPDGEVEGQPTAAALAAEARRHGLDFRHIPVVTGRIGEADIDAFAQALEELEGPVFAFCRSGTRSTGMWALSQAGRSEPAALIRTAAAAGYDLTPLAGRLEERHRAGRG
jgi:sulfide:quinone oxidoreductase